ncbi:uncharacterized protein [Triticum aestivum]|uniref:uncharacterized protein n=1 Tax=Triticum aestivum TaxID=4565 RepID=UPI001D0075B6|nr:uncharacterized protein LOC123125633 [Triticum aestivum]
MSRNLRLPIWVARPEVKGEMGSLFPSRAGLRHDIPNAENLLQFYEKMVHSMRSDRDRKWFKHVFMTFVLLNGDDFIHEFGPDGEMTTIGWTAFSRRLTSKDARMYGKWKIRWRHLFDIRFVEHLMDNYDALDYGLLASMMDEDVLGYKLQWTKKLFLPVPLMDGFSFYVVEVEEKTLVVLDPAETSIHDDEMSIKHEDNATLVLKTLRTVLRNHFSD